MTVALKDGIMDIDKATGGFESASRIDIVPDQLGSRTNMKSAPESYQVSLARDVSGAVTDGYIQAPMLSL
jgi:hypothetical protein